MRFKLPILLLLVIASLTFVVADPYPDYLKVGMEVYYPFNETSGTVAYDSTPNKNNATNTGTAQVNHAGYYGKAYYFDGANDKVQSDANTNINGDEDRAYFAWVNMNATTDEYIVSTGQSGGGLGGVMKITSGNVCFDKFGSSGCSSGTVSTGQWTHIGISYDTSSNTITFYINGSASGTWGTGGLNTASSPVTVGVAYGDFAYADGLIDEVVVLNRTVNITEVGQIMNGSYDEADIPEDDPSVSISLDFPADNNETLLNTSYFNATHTPTNANLTNTTLWVWHSNGTLIGNNFTTLTNTTDATQTTNLSLSNLTWFNNYTWNYQTCIQNATGGNHSCHFGAGNFTLERITYIVNNETYNPTSVQGTSETIEINIDLAYGVTLNSGLLWWNDTSNSPNVYSSGSNRVLNYSFTSPTVEQATNVTFFWQLNLTGDNTFTSNTTAHNQTINSQDIDDCSVNSHLIMNYTIYDENNRTFLNNNTWNTSADIYVKLGGDFTGEVFEYYASNFVTNPITICVNSSLVGGENYRLDSTVQYTADDYVTEYHYIENFSLNTTVSPVNTSLYLLDTLSSQEFLITYRDANLLPVQGAIIELTREYLDLGESLQVENMKTDTDGQTVGHFVLNDQEYTIYVWKDGILRSTYENVRAFCTDISTGNCQISLDEVQSTTSPQYFTNYKGVTGTESYDNDTSTYSFSFTTTSGGAKTINLTLYNYGATINQTYCTEQTLASAGTLNCVIPSNLLNETALVVITVDEAVWSQHYFNIRTSSAQNLSPARYILAFLLIVTIPLLGVGSGVFTLVLYIVGLVLAGGLLLVDWGGLLGPLSAFLWLVISAIILIAKAQSRRQQV